MLYHRLSYSILPLFMAFIFSLKNVSAVTCDYNEHTCYSSIYDSWCCSDDAICGSSFGSCIFYTTQPVYTTTVPPPDLSPGVAVVIVFVSIFFCILFISCCVRSHQQQRQRTSSFRTTPHPHQQQPGRRPPTVVHIRPIHNVNAVPPVHIMHEEPPPSYETVIRDLPPRYQSPPVPSAPLPTTVDQVNL